MGGLPTQNTSALALPCLQQNQGSATATSGAESKPKKKICCACPETNASWSMVKKLVQNGYRLIECAFAQRASMFEIGIRSL